MWIVAKTDQRKPSEQNFSKAFRQNFKESLFHSKKQVTRRICYFLSANIFIWYSSWNVADKFFNHRWVLSCNFYTFLWVSQFPLYTYEVAMLITLSLSLHWTHILSVFSHLLSETHSLFLKTLKWASKLQPAPSMMF